MKCKSEETNPDLIFPPFKKAKCSRNKVIGIQYMKSEKYNYK